MTKQAHAAVLILDDEPMILIDLNVALEDAGFRPVMAASARKALAALDAERVDAAVLDVNLGGGETCEAVAERLKAEGVPYLLHSGDLDRQGELVRALEAPILAKPTPARQVAAAVRDLLAADERRRA